MPLNPIIVGPLRLLEGA